MVGASSVIVAKRGASRAAAARTRSIGLLRRHPRFGSSSDARHTVRALSHLTIRSTREGAVTASNEDESVRVTRQPLQQRQIRRHLSSSSSVPAPSPPTDQTPTTLIDLSVSAKIEGEESQIATVQLKPGETLRAESASMLFMTEGVEMDTTLGGSRDGTSSAALSGAMKRMLTGQNVFLTDFTYHGDSSGTVALGTDFPSKILRLNLEDFANSTLICQRGAYLASNANVQIDMEFTKTLSAGFFGGQGFILQKLSGQGDVLVKGGGTIVVHDLAPNETLRVTSGSLVAFESSVQYDIQMMPGIKNAMFGGEGLFITTLTGPGRVYLQGMPPDRMIAEIARRVPAGGPGIGIPIGLGGGGSGESGEAAAGGADEAAAAAAGGVEGASSDEAVAATGESIQAERDATVASSASSDAADMDADSPSALFGDAAPKETTAAPENDSFSKSDDDLFSTSSSSSTTTEPTFTDDDFSSSSTSTETTFGDESQEFASESNEGFTDGELFDDTTTTTEGLGDAADAVADEDASSGVLGLLWDLLTGGDD